MSTDQNKVVEAPVKQTTGDDDFDAAFDDALSAFSLEDEPGNKGDQPAGDETPSGDEDTQKGSSDTQNGNAAPAGDGTPPAGEPKDPAPVADSTPAPAKDPAPAAAAPAPAAVVAPKDPAPQVAPEAEQFKLPEYVISDADKKVLEKFEEQWPDMPKAIQLYLAKAEHNIQNKLIVGLANTLGIVEEKIKPLTEQQQQLTYEQHMVQLRAANPDYDTVVDKVRAWIDTQPEYLQKVYKEVYDGGTVAETNDLFARFRKETGLAPAPSQQRDSAPAPRAAPAPAAAAAKAAGMAPVKGGRTSPADASAKGDPNNFDDAFQEALESGND